ncbi:hypothetical protein [Natrinema sp. CGMCC1.2065]|uniref:hypothetical protein n=1 Tax=Natrinema sp. CGMCC1.2065 TaxID=3445767 RepID=UPI003F4A59D9
MTLHDLEEIDVTLEQSLMRSGDEEVVRWTATADTDDEETKVAVDSPAEALRMLADELEDDTADGELTDHEDMIEILEAAPDGAALVAVDDLTDPNPQLHTRLYGPDSEDNVLRRYVAHMTARCLGEHYPYEFKHGAIIASGGQWSPPGAGYTNPVREFERRFEDNGGDSA